MINSPIVNDRPRREAAATEAFLEAPNEESFTELFLTLTPQLLSFFHSHGCELDLSEDLSQEVMLGRFGAFARQRAAPQIFRGNSVGRRWAPAVGADQPLRRRQCAVSGRAVADRNRHL